MIKKNNHINEHKTASIDGDSYFNMNVETLGTKTH